MKRTDSQLERAEQRLHAALKRDCPSALTLGEWDMNLLPADQAGSIAVHVTACPTCRDELNQFRAFAAEADEPETAPSFLDGIKEIVLQWLPVPALEPGLAMAGFRGAMPRAQTFTADHLWLAVTVQEAQRGRKNLLALVTRADGYPLEHGTAWLSQENRLLTGGRVDNHGNLVIEDLEPGLYDLGIQCDGTRVWVRGVSV